MGAFKKFNKQDVYISTYTAHKSWSVSGSQYSEYGIVNIPAHAGNENYLPIPESINKNYDRRLAYESLKHLYYSSFEGGKILTGSSYENYLQSSFNVSGSRNLKNVASIYSLSRDIYGTAIKPKSVVIEPDSGSEVYVNTGATEDEYSEVIGTLYGSVAALSLGGMDGFADVTSDSQQGYITAMKDDGEGNLLVINNIEGEESTKKVGNVIYPHGQIIITDEVIARYYNNYIDGKLQWKSTHPIYTYNFHCRLKENEFTHTLNPSAISGSQGIVAENVAGNEFSPYFTTIGLYNDSNELIAIGKVGQPIPIPKDTDMTVVVKLDI